jgi:hypothetical protein
MWKVAGRAPSLRVFTLAFALQLRKKHGKTTVITFHFIANFLPEDRSDWVDCVFTA